MKRILSIILVLIMVFPNFTFVKASDIKVYQMSEGGVMIEAEDLVWNNGHAVFEDPKASGGKYVNKTKDTYVTSSNVGPTDQGPTMTIRVNVKKTANYVVYFRLRTRAGTYTSIRMDLDNRGEKKLIYPIASSEFSWSAVNSYKLSEGIHDINYYFRTECWIDKIIISSNGVEFPTGYGEVPKAFSIKTVDNSKHNLMYPLPPVTPSLERPRLYLNKDNIPLVRERLNHPQNKPVYEKLQKSASLDYDGKTLDPENLTDNTDANYLEYIEANAFLYAVNGDINAGGKAIRGILNYLSSLNVDTGLAADRRGLYAVYISGMVYDWCHDLLTDSQKSDIINLALLNAAKSETYWPPTGLSAYNSDHGEEYGLLKDLFAFSIAVYGDYNEAYELAAGRLFSEYLPVRNEKYRESIFNTSGDDYGIFRSGADAYFKLLLHTLGCDNMIVENQYMQAYQQIYRRLPNSLMMQDGDIYSSPTAYNGNQVALFVGYALYDDPYLKQEFLKHNLTDKCIGSSDEKLTNSVYLIYNNVDLDYLSKKQLPLSIYAGDSSGVMVSRTSWEDGINSNAMVVSMKLPENYYGGHMHRDAGQFYIYYKGPLAIDSGVYQSTPFVDQNGRPETSNLDANSVHRWNYSAQTIAHNCMLIYDPDEDVYGYRYDIANSGGQHTYYPVANNLDSYTNGLKVNKILAKDFGKDGNKPDYTYLSGDLTGSYGKKVKEYTRSFMFLNFFDEVYPGALIVFDRVNSSNAEFKKTWLLHSQNEPEIEGTRTIIRNTSDGYNGRMINDTLLPKSDNVSVEKIGGRGKEFLIGDWNFTSYPKVKYRAETGEWRVEVSPKKSEQHNYFLNVLQVADNTLNPEPLKTELLESEKFYGVKIKDRIAFFAKEQQRISKEFKLDLRGNIDETVTVAVADLEEGTWDVIKDEKIVATGYVYEEGSVLSFTGACGEYTFKKSRSYIETHNKSFDLRDYIDNSITEETLVRLNHVFESDIDVIDRKYIPVNKIVKLVDNLAVIDETQNGQIITMYDDSKKRTVKLVDESASVDIMVNDKEQTHELSYPIRTVNNVQYIHCNDMKKVFDISSEYQEIGNIIFLVSDFARVNNSSFIVNSDDPNRAKVKDLKASGVSSTSPPYNAFDGNIATSFAVSGNDTWLVIELEESSDLNGISVIWANQTKRTEKFAIDVSSDGEKYTEVWNGESKIIDGDGYNFEDFDFVASQVKYVRLRMFGNSTNAWNTMYEMYIKKP